MARIMLALDNKEIEQQLPYSLICTTHESSVWNTMRCKNRWRCEFSDEERENAVMIFRQSHTWMMTKGVPDEVVLSLEMYKLWQKLAYFCKSI